MSPLDNKDRVGSLLILLFAAAYLLQALRLPVDPTTVGGAFTSRTLPIGLAASAIALSIVQSLLAGGAGRVSVGVSGYNWRSAGLLVVAMAVYALAFELLGFALSSVLFLLTGFAILGERRFGRCVAIAVGTIATLWLLFTKVFGLYLEPGMVYRALIGVAT